MKRITGKAGVGGSLLVVLTTTFAASADLVRHQTENGGQAIDLVGVKIISVGDTLAPVAFANVRSAVDLAPLSADRGGWTGSSNVGGLALGEALAVDGLIPQPAQAGAGLYDTGWLERRDARHPLGEVLDVSLYQNSPTAPTIAAISFERQAAQIAFDLRLAENVGPITYDLVSFDGDALITAVRVHWDGTYTMQGGILAANLELTPLSNGDYDRTDFIPAPGAVVLGALGCVAVASVRRRRAGQ